MFCQVLGTVLQWFNDIPAANMPETVNNLQCDLFAKFRIVKTRVEWKRNWRNVNIYQVQVHYL